MRNIEKWRSALIVDLGKSIGDDDFMASCPCHADDKSSLRVRVGENGEIVMHCFVCAAKGTDVCKNLGIPINWLEPDAESGEKLLPGEDDVDSVTKQLIERLGRANGKAYGPGDMKSAAMWGKGVEVAKDVILAMAVYIAGNPAKVRDELIDELARSLANRARARAIRELSEMETPLIEVAPGVFNK